MKIIKKEQYLDIIQIYRGIAALMVVFHHVFNSFEYFQKLDYPTLGRIAGYCKHGVDFFFVLSGFIISYTSYSKNGNSIQIVNYIKNRIIRIYIPYLPISLVMILLYYFLPNISESSREISLLTSLTLFPHGTPALSVAWTLTFEILFYFLFILFFISKKLWDIFIVIWVIIILFFNYISNDLIQNLESPFLILILSKYNLEFILGYLLTVLLKNQVLKSQNLLMILSILSFIFVLLDFNYHFFDFSTNLIFSLFCMIIIYFSIYDNKFVFSKTNLLMMAGNATYSIYLVHNPLQAFIVRFMPIIDDVYKLITELFLVILTCTIIGYIYYFIFEKNIMNKIKKAIL